MSSISIGAVGPGKYGLIVNRAKKAASSLLLVAGGGIATFASLTGQGLITNYFEDREQRDEIVCMTEFQDVIAMVESDPELARDQLDVDPSAAHFVSEEVYSWCGSPARVVQRALTENEASEGSGE